MTKQGILDAMRAGYGEWLAALEQVPEKRMTEPDAIVHWTVKDVVAHVASGHRWLAGQLDARAKGELPTAMACFGQAESPPPEVNIADNQQRNDWNHARYREWALDAVRQEAELASSWLEQMIEGLPDLEFAATYAIADCDDINHVRPATDDDAFRFPLWRLRYNGTAGHYPAHIRDIRNWLGQSET